MMKKFNQSFLLLVIIFLITITYSYTTYSFADTGVVSIDSFDVKYNIENGDIKSIYLDPDFHQLVVTMDTKADGTLEITIPRDILDAKFELNDDMFYVLVDDFETNFVETETNSTSRSLIIPFFKADSIIEIIGTNTPNQLISNPEIKIPDWIKNNANWWSKDLIGDTEFVSGIQYLIKEGIMTIPETPSIQPTGEDIPGWIKNNAGWWAEGLIQDTEFVSGIQYLISNGIMHV
jgi:hypothetical protein